MKKKISIICLLASILFVGKIAHDNMKRAEFLTACVKKNKHNCLEQYSIYSASFKK